MLVVLPARADDASLLQSVQIHLEGQAASWGWPLPSSLCSIPPYENAFMTYSMGIPSFCCQFFTLALEIQLPTPFSLPLSPYQRHIAFWNLAPSVWSLWAQNLSLVPFDVRRGENREKLGATIVSPFKNSLTTSLAFRNYWGRQRPLQRTIPSTTK